MKEPWLRAARICVFLVPLSVLIVSRSLYFPFVTGKAIFFRTVVELGLFFYAAHLASGAGRPERERALRTIRHPLFIAVAVFTLSYLLACATSLFPWNSYWSNFERGEGGLQMTHYGIYFGLSALLLRSCQDWVAYSAWFVVLGFLVSLYALGQRFLGTSWGFLGDGGRASGTLGNALYLGGFILFTIFHAGRLALEWPRLRRVLAVYGLFQIYVLLSLSQSRACMAALAAGTLAALAVVAFRRDRGHRLAVAALAVTIVFGALFLTTWRSPIWSRVPGLSRFTQAASSGFFAGTENRRMVWSAAWKGFQDRPILGWGPENFAAVWDLYYDPRLYNVESWMDRAHSVPLEYLTGGGLVLLSAYLAIWVVLGLELWRARRALSTHVLALSVGLGVAYVVQGLTAFEVLPLYVALFGFLAWVIQAREPEPSPAPAPSPELPRRLAAAALILLGVGLFFTWTYSNVLPYRLAKSLQTAIDETDDGKVFATFVGGDGKSGVLRQFAPMGREEVVYRYIHFIGHSFLKRSQDEKLWNHREVVRTLTRTAGETFDTLQRSPMRPPGIRVLYTCGTLHVEASRLLLDLGMLESGMKYFREGEARAPARLEFVFGLLDAAVARRDRSLGREMLEKARTLRPGIEGLEFYEMVMSSIQATSSTPSTSDERR